jgi:hypothetical protein
MASTVVVDVRVWLVAALQGIVGANVSVTYSRGDPAKLGKEAIWTLPAAATEVKPHGHRAVKFCREETLEVPFVISIAGDGLAQEQADRRCIEIFGVIDDWLALTDNVQAVGANLGANRQVIGATVASWEQLAGQTEKGHTSELLVTLNVNAQSL